MYVVPQKLLLFLWDKSIFKQGKHGVLLMYPATHLYFLFFPKSDGWLTSQCIPTCWKYVIINILNLLTTISWHCRSISHATLRNDTCRVTVILYLFFQKTLMLYCCTAFCWWYRLFGLSACSAENFSLCESWMLVQTGVSRNDLSLFGSVRQPLL